MRENRAPIDKLRPTVRAAQRLRFGDLDRCRWLDVEPLREFDARPDLLEGYAKARMRLPPLPRDGEVPFIR